MSEKQSPKSSESLKSAESVDVRAQLDRLGEKLAEQAEKESTEHDRSKETKEAGKQAEKLALSTKEQLSDSGEEKPKKQPITRGHKKQTYRATMKRVESKLPSYQRLFSKVINNDSVDKASAVAGRTVARPSGVLGGSIAAFIGLAAVTYYASQLGFEVSPALFVVLLAIGWTTGLVSELIYKSIKKVFNR